MSDETKEALLDATRRALIENGYHGLSIAKIDEEFDRSKSLIHYHFDSKADLLAALIRREREQRIEKFNALPKDPEQRLSALLDMLLREFDEWAESDPLAPRLIELYAAAPQHEQIRTELRQLDKVFQDALVETVAEGVEKGVFHDTDPEMIGRLLMAGHDSASFRWLVGESEAGEAIADALEEAVLSEVRV